MIKEEITTQIEIDFDAHIYNGSNLHSLAFLYSAIAMFELAKKIDMLDEFGIKDWNNELKCLREYLELQGVVE